tara:strand:+ start:169 stop:345 length:177 start_codon:yes stop_codon:yes gene_type:complete
MPKEKSRPSKGSPASFGGGGLAAALGAHGGGATTTAASNGPSLLSAVLGDSSLDPEAQ